MYQGSSTALNLFDDPEFWCGENDRKWSRHPDTVNRAINCVRESMWLELIELFGGVEPNNNDIMTLIREENRYEKNDGYVEVWITEDLSLFIWRDE